MILPEPKNPLLQRDPLTQKIKEVIAVKRVETRSPFQIVFASFMGLRHGVKWGCPSESMVRSRALAMGYKWEDVEQEFHVHYQRSHELEYALAQTPEDQIIELELDNENDPTIWRGVKDKPYWILADYWDLRTDREIAGLEEKS